MGALLLLGVACSDEPVRLPADGGAQPGPDVGGEDAAPDDAGTPPDAGRPDGGGDADPSDGGAAPPRVTWEPLGLEGVDIEEVHVIDGRIHAVTRSGYFWRPVDDGAAWSAGAFDRANALVELDDRLVLSVGFVDPSLRQSTDGGETWSPVPGMFGELDPERVRDFAKHGDDLLATGTAVVARSSDDGQTWTAIYGGFGGFATGLGEVHVDPRDGEIWAGGQNAVEAAVFVRSDDDGATWDEWSGLIGPPSVLKDIGFHPTDLDIVFAGFEEGLLRTTDDGETWTTVIDRHEDAKFFFGVEVDDDFPSTVYAGGWIKRFDSPQPMVLHISDDGGDTWVEHAGPAEFGGIWHMVQIERPADEPAELILGLQHGGVWRARIAR